MSTLTQQIADKYQGSVPQRIINAVEKAAARTGADFSLLMQKASAESGFDASAKSKSSSATGLFQFIDSTWLTMVKQYGDKYGLGNLASQIDMKNGKPCVTDCKVKDAILKLRNNPELSALMAGEMTADDKQYLEQHTDGSVGKTEMYLAHFLGAGGAAKFLNKRDDNGNLAAASVFPHEARANRSIFFDKAGRPRTLDQVYSLFSRKINDDSTAVASTDTPDAATSPLSSTAASTPAPASTAALTLMQNVVAQALPSSNAGGISWDDTAGSSSGFSHASPIPNSKLSAENMLVIAQMQNHATHHGLRSDKPHYNS